MKPRCPANALPCSCPCPDIRPIGVLLVEDHEAVVAGLSALILSHAPELRLLGAARDGRSALALAQRCPADVIVLDVLLGTENGLDLLPELLSTSKASVVVLTWSDDAATRTRALALGASAFVAKSAPGWELLSAIRASASDRPPCHVTKAP